MTFLATHDGVLLREVLKLVTNTVCRATSSVKLGVLPRGFRCVHQAESTGPRVKMGRAECGGSGGIKPDSRENGVLG